MICNFKAVNCPTYNLYLLNSSTKSLFFYFSLLVGIILKFLTSSFRNSFQRSSYNFKIFIQTLLSLVFLLVTSYSSHALMSQTSNAINGDAPYLTFDNWLTRVENIEDALWISLSNGIKYTASTNTSSITPIQLPIEGQSFADIGMLVPTNASSITLSSLIGPPYNYWGDDDGDTDVTATGTLSLFITDIEGQTVLRDTVLEICKAPYKVQLTSSNGTLSTRYGFPNTRNFSATSVTYNINPKSSPVVCFAAPNLNAGREDRWGNDFRGPASIWDQDNGFLPQSSYDLNFPTTGANGLYFDLDIVEVLTRHCLGHRLLLVV